ncbi:pro-MCH [Sebastes umbrosus]|uniref:pro-MCH n=1 Tax=Sebastes umbrosus TaxID=72105 RepID=UPI00189C6550|nr:pro-MCH [Sebastes umbrosus]
MMISVHSVLYTLVLFSELSSILAMPATKVEDGVAEQDVQLFLGDEAMTESAVVPPAYRRSFVLDTNVRDEEDGSPKIIIISNVGLKGRSIRGLNSAFTRSLPLLKERSLSYAPEEHSLKTDRRSPDIDVLRCMIGRVYRPCWEV